MPGKKNGYRAGVPSQPYTKWDTDKDEIEVDYKQMDDAGSGSLHSLPHGESWFDGRKGHVLKGLLVVTALLLGLIIGYVIRRNVHEMILHPSKHCAYTDGYEGYSAAISERLKQSIHAKHIEENLRSYTSSDHLAATHNNLLLRDELRAQMEALGLDPVSYATYSVLLSYPKWGTPNTVSLVDGDGQVQYTTKYQGPREFQQHPELRQSYSAFSPNGSVTGDIVYANFGEDSDFDRLALHNISVKGKIVIMRVGRIAKGQMVVNAASEGASGVLLYTDPSEVVGQTARLDAVHPQSWWLPGWASQRGTILREVSGDPLSPGLPSTAGMYRIPLEEAGLPTIPVQPIGYDDAHDIMIHMTGQVVSQDFIGAHVMNVTYNSGPGYKEPRKDWKVKLDVYNELDQREITNVIGVIKGKEEPDRYVIIGCHYDAWTFGGIDPGSGLAILMELAKAYGQMKLKGWHPRRTLLFVAWDGEEQGLLGSYEWVEERRAELADRTVTYVNLDVAVRGNFTLNVQASPMLHSLVMNATKMFPAATNDESIYDVWTRNSPSDDDIDIPDIQCVGGGSDQAAFIYLLGVPCLWPRYQFNVRRYGMLHDPAYHTTLDSFDYVKKYIDPNFHAHESLAWVVGEVVLRLATSNKLPFDVRELGRLLQTTFNSLSALLTQGGVRRSELDELQYAIGNFSQTTLQFHDAFMAADIENVLTMRAFNDKVMRVSQAFLQPTTAGNNGRPAFRNILFAPSPMHHAPFTGILDSYSVIDRAEDTQHKAAAIPELKKQISLATLAIQSARRILSDDLLLQTNQK